MGDLENISEANRDEAKQCVTFIFYMHVLLVSAAQTKKRDIIQKKLNAAFTL